ncbi:Os01g0729700 [Oryza sativa Japonica Group]|uniref:Os01g0729700 protein n=2 Tax=Oryza sativa subsp. japonica TaxID=39947 RepID=Q0JJM7_ORYSJ|nr:hypothetical protein EE612_005496 [Oryza sativa]BAF06051.1 Os01g0729700 [Oryza sativa Japonica Group]BAS74164.1 Os01g0729700 [Oryza sativa Japonica Group]|eukprot:NP_001044137.1 Os01g0729700 [Oryza sativa Japonica Group]
MPVTLLHAEKDPSMGRPARSGAASAASRASRSRWPSSGRSPISTTSARLSRHVSRLEWCSYGPTKTTHRSDGGRTSSATERSVGGTAMPVTSWSRLMAAVQPVPQKSSTSSAPAPRLRFTYFAASDASLLVCKPT